MAVQELIDRLPTLSTIELRRLKSAVDEQLRPSPAPPLTEEDVLRRMEAAGLIIRPRPGTPYNPRLEPPIDLEGEPLSEQMLRERR